MLLITVGTVVTVYLLRYILQGQIGDRIVQFLINVLHIRVSDAQMIYHLVIRNNMDMILFVVILIFLVILFRVFVSWFTRYFDEISAGMDRLAEESDTEIVLSPNWTLWKPSLIR